MRNTSLGDKYLEELDYENAEISYRKAVEISEKRESSYVKLTVLYMEQEEYEKAAQVIEEGREQTGKEEVFSDLQQKVEELESSREPEEETSQKEEEKESFDWESAFEKTVLSGTGTSDFGGSESRIFFRGAASAERSDQCRYGGV